jgi:endoglucanase
VIRAGSNGSDCWGELGVGIFTRKGLRLFVPIPLMVVLLCGAAGSLQAASTTTYLHARGEDLVNEQGEKVLLRGVGLGNWMLPEGYMWKFGNQGDRPRKIEKLVNDLIGPEDGKRFWSEFRKNYITEADIRRIAELGYNSVRPALNSRLFLSETGIPTGAEEGFVLLDHLIAWGKAHGVYVILDMHGAPGGQTGQNIDDSANDQPELFMEQKYQDQLVALWTVIARRYQNEPTVAGYDLLNEPLPERTGAAKTYKTHLEPLYQRITQAIRVVDPKHLIILEGADWSNDWSVFSAPFDQNLVYQFHYYCWDNPPVLKSVQRFLDYRQRFHAPVWVGETGEKDNTIYWATTEYFEANNIGWSFWPWKKMDTQNTPYSIKPPTGWAAVSAYSRGDEKPSREIANKAFAELLVNIRLENCVFFPDVVNAMLRRAPARIEGENYGHEGPSKSYHVTDPRQLSKQFRLLEPVAIISTPSSRRHSEQYVSLNAKEWVAYTIWSETPQSYKLTVKVKAANAPAEAQLIVGDETRHVTLAENTWSEIKLGTIPLTQGTNQLRWLVIGGTADLDWLELSPADKSQ